MVHTVLRSVGGALQIVGVATLVFEFYHARRQFRLGSPGWLRKSRALGHRLLRIIGLRKPATIAVSGSCSATATASCEARVIKSLEGKPVDTQIDILAERIQEIWEAFPRKLNGEAALRAKADEDETRGGIEATKKVLDAMQESALGGFRVRGYGAALIIVGTALATWG